MKNQIYISVMVLMVAFRLQGQELIVNSRFGPTYTHEQGGLIMTSTLGPLIKGEVIQNNIILVTDHLLFPFTTDTTSTYSPGFLEGIETYPNPVADVFMLRRHNFMGHYVITMYDAVGRQIRKQLWEDGSDVMPISFGTMSEGIYLLNIVDEETHLQRCFKIIKQ